MQFVGQILTGVEIADAEGVVLGARDVGRPGEAAMVVAHLERAEVEELVSVGLRVLIEQHVLGGGGGGAPAAVDRVALSLDRAAGVEPFTERHRCRLVGLLHARLDLAEQGVEEFLVLGEPGVGVGILGLEVGDRGRVVTVAQPRIRVVDGAARALPGVRATLRSGFVHAVQATAWEGDGPAL